MNFKDIFFSGSTLSRSLSPTKDTPVLNQYSTFPTIYLTVTHRDAVASSSNVCNKQQKILVHNTIFLEKQQLVLKF